MAFVPDPAQPLKFGSLLPLADLSSLFAPLVRTFAYTPMWEGPVASPKLVDEAGDKFSLAVKEGQWAGSLVHCDGVVCSASIRTVWASIWMDDAGVGRRLGVARP
jgi:hypothetical protein